MNFDVWIINEGIDEYTRNAKDMHELLSTLNGKVFEYSVSLGGNYWNLDVGVETHFHGVLNYIDLYNMFTWIQVSIQYEG